ncbi:MAG: hypothetical protein IH830_00890 [Planctomycetes bacterium]|nr:hypothetical protein [Planctomycetota bacterium]
MAWIEQTKKQSRKSGGPQYYLQGLNEHINQLLRHNQRREVRLWTPYGVVDPGLQAVSSSVGRVGHDRVQSAGRARTIADQIAYWYSLKRRDIERIDFEDSFDHNNCFVIRPTKIKFFNRKARKTVYPDSNPLTIIRGRQAPLLTNHFRSTLQRDRSKREWVTDQICSLVADHKPTAPNVDERDLLRASGALDMLGIRLGTYRLKDIDCPDASFTADGFPAYPCPIEVEERSSGFLASHHKKHRKERVVVLCMEHDRDEVLSGYVDIIELRELCRLLKEAA